MSSYGSKVPPPLLAPASFSLRSAGILVATAFLVSMVFMGAVLQSVGVDGIAPNQLRNGDNSLTTLRFTAEVDSGSIPEQLLEQLKLQLNEEDNVRVVVAYDANHPVPSGQFVPMNEAQDAPSIFVEGGAVDSGDRYTYVLVDIDAPDPKAPTHAPFLHYILAGITVDDLSIEDKQGQEVVVVPYYPVTPPVGEHRYVSLLFRQKGDGLDAPDDELTAKRVNFDVAGFAAEHKLELVATSTFHSHPAEQDN